MNFLKNFKVVSGIMTWALIVAGGLGGIVFLLSDKHPVIAVIGAAAFITLAVTTLMTVIQRAA